MQEQEVAFKIDHYLELALRRRWLIIIPFCLAMIVGIFMAITLPRIYESNTLILVRPQRVPENYVRSIVSTDIESRISTISQQILSRTNLEKIIKQFNLYSKPEQADMFIEDKIANLRNRIKVQVTRTRRDADAFTISFSGQEPQLVMNVANTLATFFIDENLKVREQQAIGTDIFLNEELSSMRDRLKELEVALKDYRQKYMGELPEQLQTNLTILRQLQDQLIEKQKNLRETKEILSTLKRQMSDLADIQNYSPIIVPETDSDFELETENTAKLDELKEKLAYLKLKYTDQHPDVIRLKKNIADLEAQIEKTSEEMVEEVPSESIEAQSELSEMGFEDLQNAQQEEIKGDIRGLKAEIATLMRQIRIYQTRVENTPKREQEILSLQRDYTNVKDSYDSLLKRKLEAEIAVNMEKKQKGEQFSIIDPARIPEKPVAPNMQILFLMSLAVGLGVGGGLIFLLDFFDTSLRRPENFEPVLGIPVLATVPRIFQPKDARRRRFNHVMTIFSLVVAMCLLAGFAILVFHGVESTMQIVRPYLAVVKL